MKSTRAEVFTAIDGERVYQDSKWGTIDTHGHSVMEYLVFMRDYVEEALHTLSREATSDPNALDAVRKIGALATACMEHHGAPRRPRQHTTWKII